MKTIYIIIINYGTPADTIECLESIENNDYKNYKVVILEIQDLNNSRRMLADWINSHNSNKYLMLGLSENKGFAFANNLGIKYATKHNDCEYLWILNNDTVLKKETISSLVNFYENNSKKLKIGFIGSKILYYDFPDTIQTVGGKINKWTAHSKLIGLNKKDKGQYDNKILKTDYVIGAAMFLHKNLISEIGLMPEEYFLYAEDKDWSIAALRRGFTNYVYTRSILYHKEGASIGNSHKTKEINAPLLKLKYQNTIKLYRKYYKFQMPILYLAFVKKMLGRFVRREYQEAKIIINVILRRK